MVTRDCALGLLLLRTGGRLSCLSGECGLRRMSKALTLRIVSYSVYSRMHAICSLSKNRSFLVSLTLTLKLSSLSDGGLGIRSLFVSRNFKSLSTSDLHATVRTLRRLRVRKQGVKIVSRIRRVDRHVSIRVRLRGSIGKGDRVIVDSIWWPLFQTVHQGKGMVQRVPALHLHANFTLLRGAFHSVPSERGEGKDNIPVPFT